MEMETLLMTLQTLLHQVVMGATTKCGSSMAMDRLTTHPRGNAWTWVYHCYRFMVSLDSGMCFQMEAMTTWLWCTHALVSSGKIGSAKGILSSMRDRVNA